MVSMLPSDFRKLRVNTHSHSWEERLLLHPSLAPVPRATRRFFGWSREPVLQEVLQPW